MEWHSVLHESCTNTSKTVEAEPFWTLACSENVLMPPQRWASATFLCIWTYGWREEPEEDSRILGASDTFAEGFLREESWKVLGSSLYLTSCNHAHVHRNEFSCPCACDCVKNSSLWARSAFVNWEQGKHLRPHMLLVWREILRKSQFCCSWTWFWSVSFKWPCMCAHAFVCVCVLTLQPSYNKIKTKEICWPVTANCHGLNLSLKRRWAES